MDGNLSDNLKKLSWLKLKMTLKYEKIDCQKKHLCKQRIWTSVRKHMLKFAKSNISLLLSTL